MMIYPVMTQDTLNLLSMFLPVLFLQTGLMFTIWTDQSMDRVIPDSMKDPKAFENVADQELEANSKLIKQIHENVVVDDPKA